MGDLKPAAPAGAILGTRDDRDELAAAVRARIIAEALEFFDAQFDRAEAQLRALVTETPGLARAVDQYRAELKQARAKAEVRIKAEVAWLYDTMTGAPDQAGEPQH